ncbi:MAG: hypothetical protein IJN96_02415 [Clostridia bacterium]|nr:hypothetical protein [Clostridia bacterium]
MVDNFSYFFITNVIILTLTGTALLFLATQYKLKKQEKPSMLDIKQIANIAVRCFFSQSISLLSIIILKEMSASVYSVTTTALGLVGAALLSGFIFKEKFPPENFLALVLAVAAIIIGS